MIWTEPTWVNLSPGAKALLHMLLTHPNAEGLNDDLQAALVGLPRRLARHDKAVPCYEEAVEELMEVDALDGDGFVQAREWWLGLMGLPAPQLQLVPGGPR